MLIIKTNELSNNTKKTMKQRIFSSFFIISFFVILFILGGLADNVNDWSPLPMLGREICAWLLLIYLLPAILISCREINNIFFKFNWTTQILITLCSVCLIYSPTMVYFLKYYKYIDFIEISSDIAQVNTVTNIFAIVLTFSILITVIINTIILGFNHILTFKNWFILNLLVGVVSGFYLGSCFFLFTRGWLSLFWLMLIVAGSDSFSYFGGILFGKHKMAPKISPKKTWEGFVIGQLLTIGVAILALYGFSFINHDPDVLKQIMGIQFQQMQNDEIINQFNHDNPKWWILMTFITIILSVLSVLGDLMYSWFKRKYRIKDYGTLIPGHGGIVDRIDSHSVVISFYFALSFFIALFAHTVVFFEPVVGVLT